MRPAAVPGSDRPVVAAGFEKGPDARATREVLVGVRGGKREDGRRVLQIFRPWCDGDSESWRRMRPAPAR